MYIYNFSLCMYFSYRSRVCAGITTISSRVLQLHSLWKSSRPTLPPVVCSKNDILFKNFSHTYPFGHAHHTYNKYVLTFTRNCVCVCYIYN